MGASFGKWILAGLITGALFGVAEIAVEHVFRERTGSNLSDDATDPDPEKV